MGGEVRVKQGERHLWSPAGDEMLRTSLERVSEDCRAPK